ncbi:PREDICTED: regenerating islet-derived protein 4 [Galeopterus variegatus]|uniref:Regenerating islet-derived protein 4 n=1 Tax=Galeopterus variegatus TaxID=482537 RepID=A0ABM0SJG9_GALVR|nr:PREDICTED: regenerating islet-derived protein 4 [Galeopterus variegatus]
MRLRLLLSCAAGTGVLCNTIMCPSCTIGWFVHRSNCYGYFWKLRNWSDAEVRNLAHAWTDFSRARCQPEPWISSDSGSSVFPWHSEEKLPGWGKDRRVLC